MTTRLPFRGAFFSDSLLDADLRGCFGDAQAGPIAQEADQGGGIGGQENTTDVGASQRRWVYHELAFVVPVEFLRDVAEGCGVEDELVLCPGGGTGNVGVRVFPGRLRCNGNLLTCRQEDAARECRRAAGRNGRQRRC